MPLPTSIPSTHFAITPDSEEGSKLLAFKKLSRIVVYLDFNSGVAALAIISFKRISLWRAWLLILPYANPAPKGTKEETPKANAFCSLYPLVLSYSILAAKSSGDISP